MSVGIGRYAPIFLLPIPSAIGFRSISMVFSVPTHSGTLSLRQRELFGAEVWFPTAQSQATARQHSEGQVSSLGLGLKDEAWTPGSANFRYRVRTDRWLDGRLYTSNAQILSSYNFGSN